MFTPLEKDSIGIQLTLNHGYATDVEFLDKLQALKESGCNHVELNIPYPQDTPSVEVNTVLNRYDLKCTNFATGGLYPGQVTSLSHSDQEVRKKSVQSIKSVIDYCNDANFNGLILGFVQGSSTKDRDKARELFKKSIEELIPYAEKSGVVIVVEALNRYISNVCNTLDDTVSLLKDYPKEVVAILPDTFHMNIEESNMVLPLITHAPWFRSIHFSDNNRYFPGMGAINFQEVYRALCSAGFTGCLTIEGNVKSDWIRELSGSAQLMRNLVENEKNFFL